MSPELKKKIQVVLIAAIAMAGGRTAYIFYSRWGSGPTLAQNQTVPLQADYYVTPKKLYPYDLKSARQLTNQPVWVKEGYRYTYYPYDRARRIVDLQKEAGLLLPIERLRIVDVITAPSPGSPDQRQVMAVFARDGKDFAFPIGFAKSGEYKIYSDEILYIQDPHELYQHWPAQTWEAIDRHEVQPGMNELQVDFAIGMGIPDRSSDPAAKTVHYPNGGKPLSITYRDGRVAEIKPGPSA